MTTTATDSTIPLSKLPVLVQQQSTELKCKTDKPIFQMNLQRLQPKVRQRYKEYITHKREMDFLL